MVPELEDLEKRGIFSNKEIKMLVRRRTDFEHRISGPGATPEDFLRYIKFEKNVDRLRKKRKARFIKAMNKESGVSEWSIVKRTFFIFDRAVNRFPYDMDLWSNYLTFARKNESVSKVYAIFSKLIALQPTNVDIWLSGAKWEFESNKNIEGARILFKKCLRFNSDSEKVWFEFIKLELNYLSKLLTRRKLLKLVSEQSQIEDIQNEENNTSEGSNLLDFRAVDKEEVQATLKMLPDMNASTIGNIEDNPVLRGDLILAIFEVYLTTMLKKYTTVQEKQRHCVRIVKETISLVDLFDILDREYMISKMVEQVLQMYEISEILIIKLTLSLRYTKLSDPDFVDKLKNNIQFYQAWKIKSKNFNDKEQINKLYIKYLTENYLNYSSGETQQLLSILIKKL